MISAEDAQGRAVCVDSETAAAKLIPTNQSGNQGLSQKQQNLRKLFLSTDGKVFEEKQSRLGADSTAPDGTADHHVDPLCATS